MKRFIRVLLMLGLALGLAELSRASMFPRIEVYSTEAAPVTVKENSITSVGTPTTVSISTSAWTKVPATSTLSSRNGLAVSLPASATAVMVGHFGGCTSTAVATTVRPMELAKGSFIFVPVSNDVCLWLLSLNTSAENVHVQEIKQ